MTAHTQYTELMSLMLDGEAASDQQEMLRKHLSECPDCAVVWQVWQALDDSFREEPMVVPSPDLARRVATRIEERGRWRAWTRWLGASLLIAWLGIAALALLFAVTAVWWGLTHPLQAGTVLSASTHVLSAILWPVRGAEMALAGAGLSLWAGIGGYLVVTGILLGVWLRLAFRSPAFVQARVQ